LAGLVLVQIMPIAWFAIKGRAGGYLATYYLLPFFFSLSPKRYRQEYQTAAASQVKNISKLNWTNAAKFSRSLSPLLLLAAAGLIMGVGHSWWPWSLTCLLGITASSLLILLRGEAYPQYWQNFLIWLCLPAGGALAQTVRAMSWPPAQPAPWLALFGLAWLFIKAIRDDRSFYYWGKNQYGWLKKAHGENMVRIYQAYRQLAVRIKENTDPEDSILLAGNPMQVLLYCQRDHFLPEFNQTTDCLQGLYKDKNTSPLQPINHWLGFDIAPPRTNPFNSGQPALIISADGNNNPAGWQKLLKAPLEQVPEFPDLPVWRVNREAKDLLELYTTPIDHEDAMPQINKYRRQLVTSFDSKNWEGVDQALRFLIKMDPQARLEYTFLLGDYLSMQNKLNLFIYICEKLVNLKIFGGEQAVILTKKAELLLIKSKSDSP